MGMSDITRMVQQAFARLEVRLNTMIRRTRVDAVDATGARTLVTVSSSELEKGDQAEFVQTHGFASNPPTGSRAILLCVGGNAGHPLVIAAGSAATRLTGLASGEAAMYVDGTTGARVVVRARGDVEATPAAGWQVIMGPAGAAKLPVARATDPILVNASDLATLNAIVTAWNATQPGGGPLLAAPGVTLAAITGAGTITAGGTGSTSS